MRALALAVLLLGLVACSDEPDTSDPRQNYLNSLREAVPELEQASDRSLLAYGETTCNSFLFGWSEGQAYVWLKYEPADRFDVDPESFASAMVEAAQEHLCPNIEREQ